MRIQPTLVLLLSLAIVRTAQGVEPLRVGAFEVDASPPIGSPMAYDPTKAVETPLTCRGVVIIGDEAPVVLCALDWIGLANGGQTEFREKLAAAAGTTPNCVAVHALHQHDATRCDFSADALLHQQFGLSGAGFDLAYARDVVTRAAAAVKKAVKIATPVTHLGLGIGEIEQVASNRRILGPDGKVLHVRWTATTDPVVRAFPVGTIDPQLKLISFWNSDKPIAALTFYATHPQSYYRTGLANPDFPGLARNARQDATGVPHIHLNGAGGNISAGKWNDGAHENRQILADRVAAGMKLAWENTKKEPITAADASWSVEPVLLPLSPHVDEQKLLQTAANADAKPGDRFTAAQDLVWLRRCKAGETVDIGCLALKNARVLTMPGELFVEYQLWAQEARPDLFVAMAAYGEYGPGYIGTRIAFDEGGYETGPGASHVAPDVEDVLMGAVRKLLKAPAK
jgi:hypothetical protein